MITTLSGGNTGTPLSVCGESEMCHQWAVASPQSRLCSALRGDTETRIIYQFALPYNSLVGTKYLKKIISYKITMKNYTNFKTVTL